MWLFNGKYHSNIYDKHQEEHMNLNKCNILKNEPGQSNIIVGAVVVFDRKEPLDSAG